MTNNKKNFTDNARSIIENISFAEDEVRFLKQKVSNLEEQLKISQVTLVPLTKIKTNPFQPRKHFNQEDIRILAESIKENGLLQPIVIDQDFKIIAGERRYRAFHLLESENKGEFERIQAIQLRVESESQSIEKALLENLARVNLNFQEKAEGIKILVDFYTENPTTEILEEADQNIHAEKSKRIPAAVNNYISKLIGLTPRRIRQILQEYHEKQSDKDQPYEAENIWQDLSIEQSDASGKWKKKAYKNKVIYTFQLSPEDAQKFEALVGL